MKGVAQGPIGMIALINSKLPASLSRACELPARARELEADLAPTPASPGCWGTVARRGGTKPQPRCVEGRRKSVAHTGFRMF